MSKNINLFITTSVRTKKITAPATEKNLSTANRIVTPTKKYKHTHSLMWLEEVYNTARGETALWVAVITQAMMDALSRCKKSESRYQKY